MGVYYYVWDTANNELFSLGKSSFLGDAVEESLILYSKDNDEFQESCLSYLKDIYEDNFDEEYFKSLINRIYEYLKEKDINKIKILSDCDMDFIQDIFYSIDKIENQISFEIEDINFNKRFKVVGSKFANDYNENLEYIG